MIHLLAIDGTAIIISAIGAIVSLGTVAMTLLIKKRLDTVNKQIDGMKSELVAAVKSKAEADTKLQAIAVISPELKELAEIKPVENNPHPDIKDGLVIDKPKTKP